MTPTLRAPLGVPTMGPFAIPETLAEAYAAEGPNPPGNKNIPIAENLG